MARRACLSPATLHSRGRHGTARHVLPCTAMRDRQGLGEITRSLQQDNNNLLLEGLDFGDLRRHGGPHATRFSQQSNRVMNDATYIRGSCSVTYDCRERKMDDGWALPFLNQRGVGRDLSRERKKGEDDFINVHDCQLSYVEVEVAVEVEIRFLIKRQGKSGRSPGPPPPHTPFLLGPCGGSFRQPKSVWTLAAASLRRTRKS